MPQFSLQDVEAQLLADTSGNYKKYLLNVLRQYKNQFEELNYKMISPDEYVRFEHLNRALDAAITIIESKKPGRDQGDAFNNIF